MSHVPRTLTLELLSRRYFLGKERTRRGYQPVTLKSHRVWDPVSQAAILPRAVLDQPWLLAGPGVEAGRSAVTRARGAGGSAIAFRE